MEGAEGEGAEGEKKRLIPQLVHAMSTYCWLLAALATFYFLVFQVTNFAQPAEQFMPPAAAPTSHLLSTAAHTTLPTAGCTPMLAQYIATYAPGQVCALLSTPATHCTPMFAQHIAMYLPGQVCALLSPPATNCSASVSPPTSATHSSRSDKLKAHISGWNRLTLAFLLAAVFLIATVKPRVDAAAKAEDRAATNEDKAYQTALDELSKAHKTARRAQEDVLRANPCIFPAPGAEDPHVTLLKKARSDAVDTRGKADKKVEDLRALVGVARMGNFERVMVRLLFALSILSSLGAGICCAGAYFRSAQLEFGDSMSLPAVIGSIAAPGVPMVVAHVHFLYVALLEN